MTAGAPGSERRDTGVLLLDASCLLNLYSTGRMTEIAAALSWDLAAVDHVMEREALYVRTIGANAEEETVPVNLSPLVDEGPLLVMRLETPGEDASFVELAAVLDDGEAITGALSLNRGHSVAIDDRKARRVLGEKAPGVGVVSTLEIMRRWSESVPVQEVGRALRAMRHGATYFSGPRDPLYDWWSDIMEASDANDP